MNKLNDQRRRKTIALHACMHRNEIDPKGPCHIYIYIHIYCIRVCMYIYIHIYIVYIYIDFPIGSPKDGFTIGKNEEIVTLSKVRCPLQLIELAAE